MDPLSDVLRELQLSGSILFRAELSAPWSFSIPPSQEMAAAILPGASRLVRFHVIVSGECFVVVEDEPRRLGPGDVVLLPHGDAHLMSSAPGLPAIPVLTVLPTLTRDRVPCLVRPGPGPTTAVLCGFLACDEPIFDPLLTALPGVILERRGQEASSAWFDAMVRQVSGDRDAALRPGGRAMLGRLVELMFVEVVRRHITTLSSDEVNWLAGLHDAHVAQAVAEMHADPARAWTVTVLANRAGMSRSAFAERFRSRAGLTPMQYLAGWRLQVACGLLTRTEISIAEAAARVGYQSEAAFHRAFKRRVGEPPAAWRHKARARREGRSHDRNANT